MAVATEDFAAWLAQADIPDTHQTPGLDALLQAAFRFRQQQGSDYYSSRLLSHFLLHSGCGLKVAHIARLVGIARPTASRQQGMSSKAAIQQAHHRLRGRSHGKLLPRFAGPIAAFLLGSPRPTQAALIAFVAQTFGVSVSRIALYKFLKKFGLHDVSDPPPSPVPDHPHADPATDAPVQSPCAPALAANVSATIPLEPPAVPAPAATVAPAPAVASAPVNAANHVIAPLPVIELAQAIEPGRASAPPFCSDARNMPGPSC
jgi:hypothetical protein